MAFSKGELRLGAYDDSAVLRRPRRSLLGLPLPGVPAGGNEKLLAILAKMKRKPEVTHG
jgi:hypothetical protein